MRQLTLPPVGAKILILTCAGLLASILHILYRNPFFGGGFEGWPETINQKEAIFVAGLVLASALICWLGLAVGSPVVNQLVQPVRRSRFYALIALAIIAFIVFALVSGLVLQGFPNSGDEQALVLQAQVYAQGRLWTEPPPLMDAFRMYHYFDMGGKWVSKYSPGWALIATPFVALGLPIWIVNPVIGAATLIAFFHLARIYVKSDFAWIGALLLAASSFFILNSASYFPHSFTALCGVLFAIFASRYIAGGSSWSTFVAGAFVGLMGLTRTANAFVFALPFVASLAMSPGRRIGLIWFALGGSPFLLALMTYNRHITGKALVTVQAMLDRSFFGWPTADSLSLAAERLVELIIWTSPILLFGYIAALVFLIFRNRVSFLDWLMPITVLLFMFYAGDGGNQYGPRYYFEAWPFAVLTCLKAADDPLFRAKHTQYPAWLSAAVIASLIFEVAYLPARLEREHDVVVSRKHVFALAKKKKISNALVILSSGAGNDIRGIDAPDLLPNGPELDTQDIIYALDVGAKNDQLISLFPGRSVYFYSDGRLRPDKSDH